MSEKPFLSRRLIPCAPDGEYSGFVFRSRVSLTRAGVHLRGVVIDPAYIEELVAYGPVLKVRYVTSSGAPAESYFRYSTFLGKTAANTLRDAVRAARAAWAGRIGSAVKARPVPAPAISYPEPTSTDVRSGQRVHVALHSEKVAFPSLCPICGRSASQVSIRNVSAGDNERGMWFVPVCDEHQVGDSIRVEKWRANATDVAFSFANPDYAREFARANERANQVNRDGRPRGGGHIADGRRFIMYNYVVSAIHFSALLNSRVFCLREGESRAVPGLRYSLLTAILGWWSLAGIPFTITALSRNFKGGIDVTDRARAALAGEAVSAYGVA
jgi:hypothetical protein